ncbi:MAG: response regulator [Candidatus Latescibacterota bacterium]|nr:MAG: response regulator [Candidatus Latescibacterota bacterium]
MGKDGIYLRPLGFGRLPEVWAIVNVLLISTDEACTESLSHALESLGLGTALAGTPAAARARIKSDSPDIIVVDADNLGDSTGRFVTRLRARHAEPTVLVTGSKPDSPTLIQLIHAGIHDFIPKPFDPAAFASVISNMCETRDAPDMSDLGDTEPAGSGDAGFTPSKDIARANEKLRILNKTLRQQVSQLTILYQMGRDISDNENWSDALDRFLMALVNYTNADGAALLLFSRNQTRLTTRSSFQVATKVLKQACARLMAEWGENPRGSEIHCIESYEDRVFNTCLERLKPWRFTVVPLKHRSRSWGFLLIEKLYRSGRAFTSDYPFLNTIQTIAAEEVANASYISELRQLSRFNHKVLENINSGVVTTDLRGYVSFWNQLAAGMCPRLRGNQRVHFDSIFRSAAFGEDFFENIMRADKDTHVLEVECIGAADYRFPARLSITKMHDDNLNGTVLVGIFGDLTEQKRLENEIRRNDRLRVLGQLSAGVAHEIRNPLTGIATSAEVLAGKIGGGEKGKYIRAILEETNRLDDIIRNLLSFAKPAKPKMGKCALKDISRRVVSLLSDQANRKGVDLELRDSSADDICTADANQLTQVLLNIVLNGIQACDRGNRIEIELTNEEDSQRSVPGFARIDISDDGAGVPDEIRNSLFDPFVTTRSQGTGLGLAISQQIIEEHHGKIECEFLTKGTRFTIRLPLGDREVLTDGGTTRSAGEQ